MQPLAITCGDPAGVGPEIIASWLAEEPERGRDVVVLGPPRWLAALPPGVGTLPIGREDYAGVPGEPEPEGALTAWAAMQRAAAGCASGEFAGVVTGPVSKARLAAIGYPHPGQTEFFAAAWGGDPVMAFAGGRLRLVLATWHIPFRAVPAALTPAVLERAIRAADRLARAELGCGAGAVVRIACCGLNPHAGEEGLLGDEEQRQIEPILAPLRTAFPGLSRPQPADTVFARALKGEFDVVVALYHDQGLAPLKTVDFDTAVNLTLGLPYVRTSPDHGTAYAIAGRGQAKTGSFANAVRLARRLVSDGGQTTRGTSEGRSDSSHP